MAYEKIGWKDYPNKTTPMSAKNFEHMDEGIFANACAIDAQNETLAQLNTNLNEYETSAITVDNLASATSGINIAYSRNFTNFNFVGCSLKEAVSAREGTKIISSFDAYIDDLNYTTISLIVLNPNNVVMGCATALVLYGAVYVWADIYLDATYKLMGCCTRWVNRS